MDDVQGFLRVIGIFCILAGAALAFWAFSHAEVLVAFYWLSSGVAVGVLYIGFSKTIILLSDIRDSLQQDAEP